MMRESFAMNRPEELERFFNSFSYSEVCHELAADGTSCVSNENPLAVYHNNQVQNNSLKQVESIQAETKKGLYRNFYISTVLYDSYKLDKFQQTDMN